jgi:hypothetical protein
LSQRFSAEYPSRRRSIVLRWVCGFPWNLPEWCCVQHCQACRRVRCDDGCASRPDGRSDSHLFRGCQELGSLGGVLAGRRFSDCRLLAGHQWRYREMPGRVEPRAVPNRRRYLHQTEQGAARQYGCKYRVPRLVGNLLHNGCGQLCRALRRR